MEKREVHRNYCFPIVKPIFLKVRTSSLELRITRNRCQIGKKLREGESGEPDELGNKQERRKSERRAAEKRPKSTKKHVGDAIEQPKSVPDVLQERLGEAKWKQKGVPETSGRR